MERIRKSLEAKMNKVKLGELLRSDAMEGGSEAESKSYLERLGKKVVDNLQVRAPVTCGARSSAQ